MNSYIRLCLTLFLMVPVVLSSQELIEGVVTDNNSGNIVPYVQISVGGKQWNANEEGRFGIQISEVDSLIIFRRIGYKTQKLNLAEMLKSGKFQSIKLEENPVLFGAIIIEDIAEHSIPQSDEIMDDIKMMSQPMDAGDLLRGVAGFGVSKRGAYAQEPVFRSFRQEQINVLFDGFVQYHHACPNRMDPNITHVIPAEIEKVEIIKGPFSVRYGPSMGATLNYMTASSADKKNGLSGSVESGYEFNGNGKSGRVSLGYNARNFDLYLNGSLKDYDDYSSGLDSIVPSSFNSKDYGIKLGINPSSDQRLQLTWKQSFLRDADYAGLPMDARTDNSSLAAINYKWKNISPLLYSIQLDAYGDQVDHVMDNFDRKNFAAVEAVSTVLADTYGGKLELHLIPSVKDRIYFGVDNKIILRDGFRDRLVKKNLQTGVDLPEAKLFTDKIWQDSRMMTTGIFVENKWYPGQALTISGGIRIDMVNASINDPAEDFAALYDLEDKQEINIGGNLSAAFKIQNGISMQLALGRGVRSASIDERYINHFAVGKDPYELVGNPDLKPEINNQLEWAIRHNNEVLDVQLSVFYSKFQNLITAALDSTISRKYSPWLEPKFAKRYMNVPDAFQTGLELSVEYAFTKSLLIDGQYSYTYAQNLSWDEPVSRVPPMEAGLKITYKKKFWWISVDGRFVAKQDRVAGSFGEIETPGFSLFNARMGVKPLEGMVVGLTAENMLDTDYVEFLNWSFNKLIGDGLVREPGRNFSLYLKYSF